MKSIFCLAVLLWSGICSAEEKAQSAQTANKSVPEDKVVCERKKALGSNRIERVCMTESKRAAAKQQAQSDLQRLGRCSGNDSICSGSL